VSWAVEWSAAAESDLRRIHWREAERVARGVMRFAELGLGEIERVADSPGLFRLRVSRSVALFFADRQTRQLLVWRVFAR
jgi:plasmid stabilization system protein ParE